MKFTVHAPATTANLGPGFDCLGLALDLWNEIHVSTEAQGLHFSIEGEGADRLPRNEKNAIFASMNAYSKKHGKSLPDSIEIHCVNKIPLGSGLGSSAAAAVSGILIARTLLGLEEDLEEELKIATHIEGHPDNAAPCLFGGLVASLVDQDKIIYKCIPTPQLAIVITTPDFPFPTKKARAAIPETIPHKYAVFSLSRAVLLVEALREGNFEALETLTQDQLHQPFRLPLIPGAAQAMTAAKQAGAAAVILSGAGPSLLAFLHHPEDANAVGKAMTEEFLRNKLTSRIFTPYISVHGAYVTKN